MSSSIDQEPRLLRIRHPGLPGGAELVLRRLGVREAISRPFLIEAEAISTAEDLKADDLVGKAITCTIEQEDGKPRHFHGIVRSLARTGDFGRGYTAYRIEAVPRLWQLSRTADSRIFQEQSAKDIVQTLVDEAEAGPLVFLSAVPTTPRPYCVQYNERDLDFIQRLLDEVGAGYFFEHAEGDHTMKVAGANADFPLVPGDPLVNRPTADTFDSVTGWAPRAGLRPGRVETLDYDQLAPSNLPKKQADTLLSGQLKSGHEVFLWPGGQVVRPDADPAKLAMEAEEAQAETVSASVREPAVFAGGKVKIKPSAGGAEKSWLITETRHEAFDETHLVAGGTSGYSCAVTLIPAERTWRNPAPRPRPTMVGLQTALVTGPEGEEIHCDEYGRIKIHFLWDRSGKTDDGSSCWARVLQPFAGAWGGTWFLPRVGDEVIVGFLDGDPDRPIVVGSVYNSEMMPPFALPSKKTQSGIKTRSSKQGGEDNANILRLDDTKGSEEYYVQAEKDMKVLVKNDRTETIKGKHTETITKDCSLTIEQGNQSLVISQGNRDTKLDMGNMTTVLSMGNMETKLDLGNRSSKLALGKDETEAMQSIEFKVGQSSVKIDQTGVTIKGLMIKVEGQIQTEVKGLMVQVNGSAMLKLGGGITMIG